ncbi:MAG TPA: NAD(P)/FAD-dependent oxidoreductase [Parvularculaceae bacterium]|nr:NAD(P)/FAD-dependent oxidoreductase [Parvularculaceae bacterium]
MQAEEFDMLIIGAGLSGIGAAYHLQKECPDKSYAILEARDAIGGTWDLFRYPGIRSDSDMYTLGYSFRPWTEAKAIADGPSILDYVRETASENRIDEKIRFNTRLVRADWSSDEAMWTVTAEKGPAKEIARYRCNFLFMCSGYYDYAQGYSPAFPGADRFRGRIVHPQKWPEDLDYGGKRVVVIGSGATAVTLVPAMAQSAAHVVMLQRSPTYIASRPAEDKIANFLKRRLPAKWAYGLARWKNVLLGMYFYGRCRHQPERVKKFILDRVRDELGPDYDVEKDFAPRYNPWDQRFCLVPDSDLFAAIREGRASIATSEIETFVENGVKLKDGRILEADIIVTATGLNLLLLGGAEFTVDGAGVDFAKTLSYKGMMFSGVPNLAAAFGYTNASWTLKCDLTCDYVCRLLNVMTRRGWRMATPMNADPTIERRPWIDFSSGYIRRSIDKFPKQGSKKPWKLYQNYALDIMTLRHGRIEDGVMQFKSGAAAAEPAKTVKLAS